MRFIFALLGLLVPLFAGSPAHAQTDARMYCYQGPALPQWAPCGPGNTLPTVVGQGTYTTNVSPFGELAVVATPQNLFKDTFDTSFDTANNWNAATAAGGGVTVAQSAGQITLGTGTTANGYAYTTSKPSFATVQPGFIETGIAIKLPTLALTPTFSYGAWGTFTPAVTPTAATPISEGCGFELQPGGAAAKMYVACYAGSARTVIQDLSAATGNGKQPVDGVTHTYYQYFAGDRMAWYIDGTAASNLVASQNSGVNGPNVNTQPLGLLAVAGTSNPSSSLTLTVAATWTATTNANGWIADGIYPYRKATVKAATVQPTTADLPLVTVLRPDSPGSGPYQFQSSGAGQYALSIASVQTLTVPTGSLIAEICVETAAARYTTTGTTPSSTVGIPVAAGGCFQLAGLANLNAFKIIGAGATMDAEYMK